MKHPFGLSEGAETGLQRRHDDLRAQGDNGIDQAPQAITIQLRRGVIQQQRWGQRLLIPVKLELPKDQGRRQQFLLTPRNNVLRWTLPDPDLQIRAMRPRGC